MELLLNLLSKSGYNNWNSRGTTHNENKQMIYNIRPYNTIIMKSLYLILTFAFLMFIFPAKKIIVRSVALLHLQ